MAVVKSFLGDNSTLCTRLGFFDAAIRPMVE